MRRGAGSSGWENVWGFFWGLFTSSSQYSHELQVCVCVCVCACACAPVHTRILERRRSAALCMMKPCIGYDFCLSDIHIHAWLSGRMYKIVAATLDSLSFWLERHRQLLQHLPERGCFFSVSERGWWSLLGAGELQQQQQQQQHQSPTAVVNTAVREPSVHALLELDVCGRASLRKCGVTEMSKGHRANVIYASHCVKACLQCFFFPSISPGPRGALSLPQHTWFQMISSSSSSAEITPFVWIMCVWRGDAVKQDGPEDRDRTIPSLNNMS